MCFVAVFEMVYELAGRIFIEKVRSRTLEIWRMGLTLSTCVVATRSAEWDSADRAER